MRPGNPRHPGLQWGAVEDEAVAAAGLGLFVPPRQVLTKAARGAPVRPLASACLLQAFRDMGLTGLALAPLGVTVVVWGGGESTAKAEPQQARTTAAKAVNFILGLQAVRLHVAAADTLDGEACRRHEAGIKNASRARASHFPHGAQRRLFSRRRFDAEKRLAAGHEKITWSRSPCRAR